MHSPRKVLLSKGGAMPAAVLVAATLAPADAAVLTDTTGLMLDLRNNWNQYPDSPLSVNGVAENAAPSQIVVGLNTPGEFLRIDEGPLGNFDFGTGLPFKANSHRAWFSDDGGASRLALDFDAGFDVSVDIQINTSSDSPRKEAGFFFNTGTGSDTQFILTTDNGEVAAFAGPLPKASNVGNQGPAGLEWEGLSYASGSTATLRMQYLPPVLDPNNGAVLEAATMQYWFNGVAAYDDPEPFGDTGLQFLPPNAELALKVQTQGTDFTNDPTTATFIFSNLLIVDPVLTVPGDYNNDGSVDQGDLDLVLLNWGDDASVTGVPSGWVNEQPAGLIGQTELDGVLLSWGNTAEAAGAAVPEPATLAVLSLVGLAVGRRARGG